MHIVIHYTSRSSERIAHLIVCPSYNRKVPGSGSVHGLFSCNLVTVACNEGFQFLEQ